ncbi:VOC family protein [Chitinophaga rhizophila]|uniref:VOC family protein n=1 Tax=Chitinophaga rhizophila TaxID=2866212 RepID=A0ABS7GAP3_9BACT|nr:VOC family protein [Chitinophaga rhizophila]MBW8684739.1 VOC family protein [Chitinophaga rhizophila]
MEQRMSVITIGASDLPAMRAFYEEKLGWKPVAVNKDIVFYKMNGFLFSIGKGKDLASVIGVSNEGSGFRSVTFGYNVQTEDEVQALYRQLQEKGVKMLTTPTNPPFGGLFFYFEDIEGNILEVAYNPFVPMDEENNAIGHESIAHL